MDKNIASADANSSESIQSHVPISAIEDCVICLAPLSERAVAVPCNHCSFDFTCLASWAREQTRCPLCKCEITAIEFDWRSPGDYKRLSLGASLPMQVLTRSDHGDARPQRRWHPPNESYLKEIDIAVLRRRNVYRYQRFSLHIGSNPVSGFRRISPDMIASSESLQRKAKKWIRREIRAFDHIKFDSTHLTNPGPSNSLDRAETLLHYIIEVIKITDIKGGRAEELLREHLGMPNTPLFLHELSSWLRSPYSLMEEWDAIVQYHRTGSNHDTSHTLFRLYDVPQRPLTEWYSRTIDPEVDPLTELYHAQNEADHCG